MPTPLPCCKEFGVAEKQKKLVVVYKDNIDTIKVAPANDFNGNVLMYVVNEDQGLNPDVDEIVAELEKLLWVVRWQILCAFIKHMEYKMDYMWI